VRLGWKHAGGDWFGHQSRWPHASVFVRCAPRRGLALAVAARGHAAAIVALRMFGRHLPELFDLRAPWGPPPAARLDARWLGRYEQAAQEIEIAAAGTTLRAVYARRAASGARLGALSVLLQPAAAGIWLARPATEAVPYVQFLTGDAGEPLLWNGRCVLRKASRC
jgi:hypothetical protein